MSPTICRETRASRRGAAALLGALALLAPLAACGDDSDEPAGESGTTVSTTEAAEVEALTIVVTNDDGVEAEGIDVLVEALAGAGHEIHVVAPLDQKSGSGGTFTEGDLETSETETASGREATAVAGFPADTVRVAIDEMGLEPHLVVSGINEGQNVGPLVDVSGTIGAARAAVARDIPSLALSAGSGPFEAGYEAGAELALEWIDERLDALLAGDAPVEVASINIPSCETGEVRGLLELPSATEGDHLGTADCTSTEEDPADDTAAMAIGFATITVVPDEPNTPPQPG